MATVYLARDLKHNRNVALKVLKPELAAVVGADGRMGTAATTGDQNALNFLTRSSPRRSHHTAPAWSP